MLVSSTIDPLLFVSPSMEAVLCWVRFFCFRLALWLLALDALRLRLLLFPGSGVRLRLDLLRPLAFLRFFSGALLRVALLGTSDESVEEDCALAGVNLALIVNEPAFASASDSPPKGEDNLEEECALSGTHRFSTSSSNSKGDFHNLCWQSE